MKYCISHCLKIFSVTSNCFKYFSVLKVCYPFSQSSVTILFYSLLTNLYIRNVQE